MYSCLFSKLESKILLYFFFTLLYCPDQSRKSCENNSTLGSMKKQLLRKTKRKEPLCGIYQPGTAIQWTLQQRFQQLLPISGKICLDLDKFYSTQTLRFALEVPKPKDIDRPHLGSETISVYSKNEVQSSSPMSSGSWSFIFGSKSSPNWMQLSTQDNTYWMLHKSEHNGTSQIPSKALQKNHQYFSAF